MRAHHEGSIYRRRDTGRWVAAVSLPDGRRRTRSCETKDEAVAALAELRRRSQMPSARAALGDYLAAWLETARAEMAPATWKRYEALIRIWIVPALGSVRLERLTAGQVRSFLHSLPLHPRTVYHVRATLRRALADAVVDGLLDRNAAALAKPPPIPKRERRWLTPDELRVLFDSTAGTRWHALWVLCGTAGLRASEALGIAWGDVDLDGGRLRVRHTLHREDGEWVLRPTKTRQTRFVPLTRYTVGALRLHRATQLRDALGAGLRAGGGLVFTTERGWPLHEPNLSKYLRADLAAAGLPRVTVHDLRHSAASWLLAEGTDITVIARILGHSDPRITMTLYAHVGEGLVEDAVEKQQRRLER